MGFEEQLKSIKDSFSSAIDNYYNTYIIHQTNPDSAEYTQIYAQEKGQINGLNASLFSLQTDVKQSIDLTQKQISELADKLEREKRSNGILHTKLGEKKGKELGALSLIVESKESYNNQYLKNATLLVGDLLLVYFMYKILK
jgi:hypothetical protein